MQITPLSTHKCLGRLAEAFSCDPGILRAGSVDPLLPRSSSRDDLPDGQKPWPMAEAGSTLEMFYFYGFAGGVDDCRNRYSNLLKNQNRCCQHNAGGSGFLILTPI